MNIVETLRLALSAIWAHKLRSFLTLLGMIIGVTAVVTVVSMIQGFNSYVEEKIANIGANNFSIYRFNFFTDFKDTDTFAAAQRRNKELTLDELEFIRQRRVVIDQMGARIAPRPREVKRGSLELEGVPVSGTTADMASIENVTAEFGRYFSEPEDEAAMRVAFLGWDVADKLFPAGPASAVDQEISIEGIPYRVVGVAAAKGTVFGRPQDNFITLPMKTYIRQFGPPGRSRRLVFSGTPRSPGLYADAVEEARYLMRLKRQLPGSEPDNFAVITPDAITGARDRIFGPIFIVAIAVPAIALVVGAIVIMNIMLVSVTERTQEIGIRKAIGARRRDILWQFLIEAMTLTGLGGVIGLLVGWLTTLLIRLFVPSYVPLWAPVAGIVASVGIGLVFGLWPAWKAARLDPIEALRYE